MLVTGGSSGIGAAFVEAFCGQGCRVAFVDAPADPSHELAERLLSPPLFRQVDLRDLDSLTATIRQFRGELGGFDVLVTDAGWR